MTSGGSNRQLRDALFLGPLLSTGGQKLGNLLARLNHSDLPVLKDPALGANTNLEQFADTEWHLTPEAAALRTDALAQQIKEWDLWTTNELEKLATQKDR